MEEIANPPRKRREMRNHHMDSTVWNDFAFRSDDIVVATYGKAGTTWLQQIVAQLVFRGDPDVAVSELSPWLDLRVPPAEVKLAQLEAQTHRRVIKTHLPLDALVFSPEAKYLYVARDGRDVCFSFHHHHASANALWYELLNDTPGLVGPPIGKPDPDVRAYFRAWLDGDGFPLWPFFDNVASWWAARDLPNVRLVHFSRLKADLEGEMRMIAGFLGIALAPDAWKAALDHCRFEWMKANAAKVAPLGGAVFEGGAEAFMNRGTNGRWSEVLSPEESARYEQAALAKLGPDCARWLATGELPA